MTTDATRALIEANAKLHKQIVIAQTAMRIACNQIDYLSIDNNELCWDRGDPQDTLREALKEVSL